MLRLSVVYVGIAALELLVFVLMKLTVAAKIASVGLLTSLAALSIIAGPSYALLAVIYRAQRVRLQSLKPADKSRIRGT